VQSPDHKNLRGNQPETKLGKNVNAIYLKGFRVELFDPVFRVILVNKLFKEDKGPDDQREPYHSLEKIHKEKPETGMITEKFHYTKLTA
jgi:hypothetical protein